MTHCIKLEEVILATITADLQLRAHTVCGAVALCDLDRLDDILLVVGKAHCPLVQGTCGQDRVLLVHIAINRIIIGFLLINITGVR